MRCLTNKFFWCPLENNEEGEYCWNCHFDPQIEMIIVLPALRKGKEAIRKAKRKCKELGYHSRFL